MICSGVWPTRESPPKNESNLGQEFGCRILSHILRRFGAPCLASKNSVGSTSPRTQFLECESLVRKFDKGHNSWPPNTLEQSASKAHRMKALALGCIYLYIRTQTPLYTYIYTQMQCSVPATIRTVTVRTDTLQPHPSSPKSSHVIADTAASW